MRYHCPSCKINWEDSLEPVMQIAQPLCIFCSSRHTQSELIKWQMEHIKDVNVKDYGLIVAHMYRYFEGEIRILKDKTDE